LEFTLQRVLNFRNTIILELQTMAQSFFGLVAD